MTESAFSTLDVSIDRGVATVDINNPPTNLFDTALIVDLNQAGQALADNPDVRVVVLQSANPDFFIAHADVAEAFASGDGALEEALAVEQACFLRSARTAPAKRRMAEALALGLQTEAVETAAIEALWERLDER
jgi:enoyl-CoA hydratase/carnithine racemase